MLPHLGGTYRLEVEEQLYTSEDWAALKSNPHIDNSVQVMVLPGISIPKAWFAIIAILLFSLYLRWLPSSRYTSPLENIHESIVYLILPAFTLRFRQSAHTTRLTGSSMLDEMKEEYVDTTRSLGLLER